MLKKLNSEAAELIGMHTGDGTLYKTRSGIVWELRGGLNEKEYYISHVKGLLESLFKGEIFKPKFRSGGKNGCFGIQTCNKKVSSFFMEYDFKPRRKTHSVRIYDYIKNANKKIQFAYLRGLFDTDGHLRFERINNNPNYTYPKIELSSASLKLRDDVFDLLKKLGYKVCRWGNKYYALCIMGKDNLEKFMKEISFKNKKHLNKYVFWKEHGHNNPNAEVA
tara:strand:- start:4977 stop:5639 length:663 start_codon:yes stop_codon:yes gene_type:complete